MMKADEAKKQFGRICVAFPSYREFLAGSETGNQTLTAWAEMLVACDPVAVVQVVDGMVSGEIELRGQYETKDVLPITIRNKANSIRDERLRAERNAEVIQQAAQKVEHQSDPVKVDQATRFGRGFRLAMVLGAAVEAGSLTKDDNDVYVAAICKWVKTGDGSIVRVPEGVLESGKARQSQKRISSRN